MCVDSLIPWCTHVRRYTLIPWCTHVRRSCTEFLCPALCVSHNTYGTQKLSLYTLSYILHTGVCVWPSDVFTESRVPCRCLYVRRLHTGECFGLDVFTELRVPCRCLYVRRQPLFQSCLPVVLRCYSSVPPQR